ncbi:MAG: VCBS repeat domain-containing M23 family metallopeptidase [Patescibacteria group bacterium]
MKTKNQPSFRTQVKRRPKTKTFIFCVILSFCFLVLLSFAFAQPTDDFIYPIDNPQLSEESKFGTERYEGIFHLGDDFLAPAGTPIKVFGNGVVRHIGIHSRFGTVVLIEHQLLSGEKIVSLYGHLRRYDIQVSENQFVNKGEVIGFIGAAGQENGGWPQEHLHFGIRRGEYIDVKTKWVYWGYGTKEEMANWYNPSEFLAGKILKIIDPKNLAKIAAIPANHGRTRIKLFNARGKKIKNSDIFASRYSSYPGGDVAVAKTDKAGGRAIVVGLGKTLPYVKIYNKKDKTLIANFLAFSKKYKNGMRVAAGDINGEGIDEIIVGSGGGIRPQFKIFDLQGNLLFKKYLFKKSDKVKFGLDVAAGDMDGDKIDEIIVGLGSGSKPYVMTFKPDGTLIKKFLAYQKNFFGGVFVSAGDIDRDGAAEIITGAGAGGGPHLRIFEATGKVKPISFSPFDASFRGGIDVASADFDNDGKDEIIVSPAAQAQAWIKVYRYNAKHTVLTEFLAYKKGFEGGVNVSGMK